MLREYVSFFASTELIPFQEKPVNMYVELQMVNCK